MTLYDTAGELDKIKEEITQRGQGRAEVDVAEMLGPRAADVTFEDLMETGRVRAQQADRVAAGAPRAVAMMSAWVDGAMVGLRHNAEGGGGDAPS